MGSLSNNSRKLANFAGFYKGLQSAGAAGMWRMDAQKTPFMTEFASCWGLLVGSLFIASPVVFFKIKEHVDVEDDLEFSDEKRQDVIGVPMNEQSTNEQSTNEQPTNKHTPDEHTTTTPTSEQTTVEKPVTSPSCE